MIKEKAKPLEEAEDVSNDILNMIPNSSNINKKPSNLPSKEDKKSERFELNFKPGDISTKPIDKNSSLDMKSNDVTAGQATFKKTEEEANHPPRRSQLSKPNFGFKGK